MLLVACFESDLKTLKPELRSRLADAASLEDIFESFRDVLGQLEMVAMDEFSQDVILPLKVGYLVVGVT